MKLPATNLMQIDSVFKQCVLHKDNSMDMSKEWKRGDCQKNLRNGVHQEKENEVDLKLPGWKGLED